MIQGLKIEIEAIFKKRINQGNSGNGKPGKPTGTTGAGFANRIQEMEGRAWEKGSGESSLPCPALIQGQFL